MLVNIQLQSKPMLSARRRQVDGGGTGAGFAQEDRIRRHLEQQGYTAPFGSDDNAIAKALKLQGKRADIVMQHSNTGRWLVAESKGGDMSTALEQIENTIQGLLGQAIHANTIDVAIYTNTAQYQKLQRPPGVSGYYLNNEGYLGWYDEAEQWHSAIVYGHRVHVYPDL